MGAKKSGSRKRQSGVLPFRYGDEGVEVLLILSRKQSHWVPPKGQIEPPLSASESAAKEAYEEAGIEGLVFRRHLGAYRYRKQGQDWKVHLYPMEVTRQHREWPEADRRLREWLTVRDAAFRVQEGELAHLILTLPAWLRLKAPNIRALPGLPGGIRTAA